MEHLGSERSNAGFPFWDGWFIWDLCLGGRDVPGELGCFSVTVHLRASDQSQVLPGSPAFFGPSSDCPDMSLVAHAGQTPIPVGVWGVPRWVDLHSSGGVGCPGRWTPIPVGVQVCPAK